ncbi:MAG: SCO family protein [Chitinophagaceae bacterium]
MSKKAVYAVLIALLLPLLAYFLLKGFSDRSVAMPRYYIYDTVITKTKSGKQYSDTIWHQLPDFSFTNQEGRKVSWKDIGEKVVVADFFFTHCPTICPALTRNMKELQDGISNAQKVGSTDPTFIQFLSFSIDPERDSVAQLKKWADRFQVNSDRWWLLTGDKKEIYDYSNKEMKLIAVDGEHVDSNFIHTDIFVLIDKHRNIRGYYHTLNPDFTPDTISLSKLSRDIILLSLEKDPTRKNGPFAGKLELLAVVFLITIIAVGLFFYFFKKQSSTT